MEVVDATNECLAHVSMGSNEVAEKVKDPGATEGTEGRDGEGGSDSGEDSKRAACSKYQEFQRTCGELLDPTLEEEFAKMKDLGLPTMLINTHEDWEPADEDGASGGVAGLSKAMAMQQTHNPKKRRGKKRSSRSTGCGGALEEMYCSDTGGGLEDVDQRRHLEEQQEEYGGDDYGINWAEVGAGRCSGMPGKWRTSDDSLAMPPLSEEEVLLQALRLKAEAFSNREWSAYWGTYGPSLLATGWVATHPCISLQKLQASIQSLDYLTHAMDQLGLVGEGSHMTDEVASRASTEGTGVKEEEMGTSEEVTSENVSTVGADSRGDAEGKDSCRIDTMGGAEEDELAHLSCDHMSKLWDMHYNSYYWYFYQAFCEEQERERRVRTDEAIFSTEEKETSEPTMKSGVEEEEIMVEGEDEMVRGVEGEDEMVRGVEVDSEMVGGVEDDGEMVGGVEVDSEMVGGVEDDGEMVRGVEDDDEIVGGVEDDGEMVGGVEGDSEIGGGVEGVDSKVVEGGDGSTKCEGDVEVELAKMLVGDSVGEMVTGAPSVAAESGGGGEEEGGGGECKGPSQQREEEDEEARKGKRRRISDQCRALGFFALQKEADAGLSEPLSLHIDPEVWENFKSSKKGKKKKKKRKRLPTKPPATTQKEVELVGHIEVTTADDDDSMAVGRGDRAPGGLLEEPPKELMEVNSEHELEAESTKMPDLDQADILLDTDCISEPLCMEHTAGGEDHTSILLDEGPPCLEHTSGGEDHTSILLDEGPPCSPSTTHATVGGEAEEGGVRDDHKDVRDPAGSRLEYAGRFLSFSSLLPSSEVHDTPSLAKYWSQRYRLFSKYDSGIQLDHEGWFSATPEKIAVHLADRCRCDLIVDAFCGIGSNAIQFAFTCERVIAVDIDPVKIACAIRNAEIYGVADRIEFIVGDFFQIMPHLKRVFKMAREVCPNAAYYLPKNTSLQQIVDLAFPGEPVEVEQQLLNKRLTTITAYFGELVNADF